MYFLRTKTNKRFRTVLVSFIKRSARRDGWDAAHRPVCVYMTYPSPGTTTNVTCSPPPRPPPSPPASSAVSREGSSGKPHAVSAAHGWARRRQRRQNAGGDDVIGHEEPFPPVPLDAGRFRGRASNLRRLAHDTSPTTRGNRTASPARLGVSSFPKTNGAGAAASPARARPSSTRVTRGVQKTRTLPGTRLVPRRLTSCGSSSPGTAVLRRARSLSREARARLPRGGRETRPRERRFSSPGSPRSGASACRRPTSGPRPRAAGRRGVSERCIWPFGVTAATSSRSMRPSALSACNRAPSALTCVAKKPSSRRSASAMCAT